MQIDELQTRRKLSPRALAEITRERTAFRDQVYASRPAAEAALAGHGDPARLWSRALERALLDDGLVAWLVWLATQQPTTQQPPTQEMRPQEQPAKLRAVHPPRKHRFGHPGIDHNKGAFRARVVQGGREIYSGRFKTAEEAISAREAFLVSLQ